MYYEKTISTNPCWVMSTRYAFTGQRERLTNNLSHVYEKTFTLILTLKTLNLNNEKSGEDAELNGCSNQFLHTASPVVRLFNPRLSPEPHGMGTE